jgi:hypothetical protein
MIGNLVNDTLIGKLTTNTQITGTLNTNNQLSGTVINGEGISRSYYSGSYEATPQTTSQTLELKDKIATDDITIDAIPYREENNSYGKTVYIG